MKKLYKLNDYNFESRTLESIEVTTSLSAVDPELSINVFLYVDEGMQPIEYSVFNSIPQINEASELVGRDLVELHENLKSAESAAGGYDSLPQNEKEIINSNTDILVGENLPTAKTPLIYKAVDSDVRKKKHKSINYKNELRDGVSLHGVETFFNDGSLDAVTYYKDYVNAGNKGTEYLSVTHSWVMDTSSPTPSAASVISRMKTWKWKNGDGTTNVETKSKTKKYDTQNKKNKEGRRRRNNLVNQTQETMVPILLISASVIFTNQTMAVMSLVSFFQTYSDAFSTYLESGIGSIYDDIENDTVYPWMKTEIGNTSVSFLGLPPDYATKQIWEYAVNKLKGLI